MQTFVMLFLLKTVAHTTLILSTLGIPFLDSMPIKISSELYPNFNLKIPEINVSKSCVTDSDYTPRPPERGEGRR